MDSTSHVKLCDRPSCDFRSDPDNPYRYVCLQCGVERSTKKSDPPKKAGIEQALIWIILIVVGWLLMLWADAEQPPISPPVPPINSQVLP